MPGTRLTFNVLTFNNPEDQYTFHLTNEENESLTRAYQYLVPDEVTEHFWEQDYYYMPFDQEFDGGLAVTKCSKPKVNDQNTFFSLSILKRYYSWLIQNYFKAPVWRGRVVLSVRNMVL